jgi:mRNA-degrading endonuclease RelE of RelBE toxin-antitoxin system
VSEPKRRVRIEWTTTAKECLKKLPPKVQRGLIDKADELVESCSDPRKVHKPLTGPLATFYRITYARYRAVYGVREDELASGDFLITLTVTFIACGKRDEYSKDDIYKVARKAVELGLIQANETEPSPERPEPKPPNKRKR